MKLRWMRAALGASILTLALAACTNDSDSPTLSAQAAPDFGLQDVNPNSATNGTTVAVRDYLDMVSGWYFAHAT